MKKENDPRHEIAMAIHHISITKDGLDRGDTKDERLRYIEISTELEAAISWLNEAQEKVNK